MLVGLSGIDGSGKGFLATRLKRELERSRRRTHRLLARHAEETATAYSDHLYDFREVDVVLLEGIFIYKRAYRSHFDLALWIDCSFATALERALRRPIVLNDPRLSAARARPRETESGAGRTSG